MYEVFEHTADLGLRVRCGTLGGLFAEAAQGLFSLLIANPEAVRTVLQRPYDIEGDELDLLLRDWLSELLYTFETEKLAFAQFAVQVEPGSMSAICHGEPIDWTRHQPAHEIKAITYHGLRVAAENGIWLAELIVDI